MERGAGSVEPELEGLKAETGDLRSELGMRLRADRRGKGDRGQEPAGKIAAKRRKRGKEIE
jgi:hypothetical protein